MKKLPQKRWMSLWRHFYDRERTADELTSSMIEWQRRWNWDLLKVNPAACYHVLDWGAEYKFFDDGITEPQLVQPLVSTAQDVERVGDLDVWSGVLGEQLQVLRNLRSEFGSQLAIVETVFSPIEIAHRLMEGREQLQRLRKDFPESVHSLLQRIGSVFRKFCLACLDAGADGIFFATKWATSDSLTWQEYEDFGKRYEMPILEAMQERDVLVILHVCGPRTYLEKMLDYPVDIFSYDFYAEGALRPEEVMRKTGKFVLGGIDPLKLVSDPETILQDCSALASWNQWLAGPSCVVSHTVSDQTIESLLQSFRPIL